MFRMLHRKRPCDVCGGRGIIVEEALTQRGNSVHFSYDERCSQCGNLLFGRTQKVKKRFSLGGDNDAIDAV